MIIQAFQGKTK